MNRTLKGRRLAGLAVIAVIALGTLAASALAVVNGSPDNGRHPYVGVALWFPTGNPADGFQLCSGSLISPTVFVTAAHCFPKDAFVLVDTAEDGFADLHQSGFGQAVPGVAVPDPNWQTSSHGLSNADRNDVAVVQLLAPIQVARYAKLPTLGYDDTLANNQQVEIVGYGIQSMTPLTFGSRFDAPAKIIPGGGATGDTFLKISSSPGQGGATCNGDSGGPDLQAGTDVMLSISSYGPSATCKAVDYSQRLDTAEALRFLSPYLP